MGGEPTSCRHHQTPMHIGTADDNSSKVGGSAARKHWFEFNDSEVKEFSAETNLEQVNNNQNIVV